MSSAKDISIFLCAALLISSAPALAAPKGEWVFQFKNPQMGPTTIYITNDAFRIVNNNYHFEIIEQAPDWKAVWLKRSAKEIMIQNKVNVTMLIGMKAPVSEIPRVLSHAKYHGLNSTTYIESCGAVTIATGDVPLAPEGTKEICAFWSVPRLSQLPLKNFWPPIHAANYKNLDYTDMRQYEGLHSSVSYKFDTVDWKKVPYKSSDFEVPTGYKQIYDGKRMFFGPENVGQLEDMIDSLMFTEEENKSGKKHK